MALDTVGSQTVHAVAGLRLRKDISRALEELSDKYPDLHQVLQAPWNHELPEPVRTWNLVILGVEYVRSNYDWTAMWGRTVGAITRLIKALPRRVPGGSRPTLSTREHDTALGLHQLQSAVS